ncbi:hypothetical protein SEA_ZUCKER_9 [Arthrobacter phage Zucker]|nr:hypothetical protein SEA_ZUCKER_9 [Arthrobacter phage Zucker]
MPKFSKHVALMSPEYKAVSFGPGDDVPEWAVNQVGEHVLEPEEGKDEGPADEAPDFTGGADTSDGESEDPAGDDEEAGDEEAEKPADEAPDFTAPAPRRGRARKQ